jgi:pimeloyl-ACP methyl ester carboxylesterase
LPGTTSALPHLTTRSRHLEYRLIPASRRAAPALVLLHEGLRSIARWRDFPDHLAASTGAPILAYSRHGHGGSDRLVAPRPVDHMHYEALEVLPEVLDQLGIGSPVLIGHSDGASIALILAGGRPRSVRGPVLVEPNVFVEDKTVRAIAAAVKAYRETGLRLRVGRHPGDVDAMFRGSAGLRPRAPS